jgi:hypothetical protein
MILKMNKLYNNLQLLIINLSKKVIKLNLNKLIVIIVLLRKIKYKIKSNSSQNHYKLLNKKRMKNIKLLNWLKKKSRKYLLMYKQIQQVDKKTKSLLI